MKNIYALAFLVLLSCGSNKTQIVKSWKSPDVSVEKGEYKKILISVLVKDEETRQFVEDRIVKTNSAFYASHPIFKSKEIMQNVERSKALLKEQNFDAVITMQLVKTDVTDRFVPDTFNGGYWGYHNYYYAGFWEPGYYREENSYLIETNVFSLKEDKLLWAGITSTIDPKTLEKAIDEILNEVRSQMIKDKLISRN
jgi:hypothetical protein